jgi:hypothetical protein
MGLSPTYSRLLQVPEHRIVILPPGEPIGVAGLKTGIIFIVAKWSGASQIAFRTLNAVLAEIADLHDLKLYVADTDEEPAEQFIIQSGMIPSGGGETFWVKDGVLVAEMANYNDQKKSTLREHTLNVLYRE